jgi:8-oxo-dGTP diphosphatase
MTQVWRTVGRVSYWLSWPALYAYLRIGARARVYVVAGDQVLLVQGWLSDGRWMLPGGGLHRGEAPELGAVREVQEETGITLDPSQLELLRMTQLSYRGLKSSLYFFVARLERPLPVRPQWGEISAIQWFTVEKLGAVSHRPEVREVAELLAPRG